MAYTNLGRDTLWLYGGIVKSINRTVNKTLQGHIPEHVFSFVSKVCFVLAHCFTHPLKTKVFTSTLRLQNKAIGRFPRIYKSLRFTFNHKNLTFLLFSFPSQNRPLSNKKQLVHLDKLLKKKRDMKTLRLTKHGFFHVGDENSGKINNRNLLSRKK